MYIYIITFIYILYVYLLLLFVFRSWWNRYMFDENGRKRFFTFIFCLAMLIFVFSFFTYESQHIILQILRLIISMIGISCVFVCFITITDKNIVRCIIVRWEFIYLIINSLLLQITFMFIYYHTLPKNTDILVLHIIIIAAGTFLGFLVSVCVYVLDAVPYSIMTRKYRICLIGIITMLTCYQWIFPAILENDSELKMCLLFCSSANKILVTNEKHTYARTPA